MLRLAAVPFLLLGLLTPVLLSGQEYQIRTWKTADGAHSVKAKMIEATGDSVVLEKENGKRVTVKLEILSDADREYVANVVNPASATNQPAETFQRKARRDRGEMDYNDVIVLQADREIPWQPIQAVPLSMPELGACTTFAIDEDVSFGSGTGLISDPSGSKLLFVSGSFQETTGRVFDLVTGKPLGGAFSLPRKSQALAISADSTSLIMLPGLARRGSVTWLVASRNGIRERLTWRFSPEMRAELSFAKFVGDGLLVTTDSLGVISLWDLHSRTLVWQIQSSEACTPAISHDLGTLVSCNGRFLFQIDLRKNKIVSCVPLETAPTCLGFSPAGDELICVSQGVLRRIDVSNAEVEANWNLDSVGNRARILGWINETQFVLSKSGRGNGSLHLVDLNLQGCIAYYQVRTVNNSVVMDGMGRVWCLLRDAKVGGEVAYTIEGNELPHEKIVRWCQQQTREDLVLLRQGDSINLQISAVVHDATPGQVETLKEIHRSVSNQPQNDGRRDSSGRSNRSGGNSRIDRLANAMQSVQLASYDAQEEAREIIMQKLGNDGLRISSDAEYTLHVEIGHPAEISVLNDTGNAGPKPLPYSLKWHAYLTDRNGKQVWKSASRGFSALPSSAQAAIPTTGPKGVQHLKKLEIPRTFVDVRRTGYSVIKAGEIEDKGE